MRALLVVMMLGGCLGTSTGGSEGALRPIVVPSLSSLPSDPERRDAILDSSNVVAGPEQRPDMTLREYQVETAAATVAAVLGSIFSSH